MMYILYPFILLVMLFHIVIILWAAVAYITGLLSNFMLIVFCDDINDNH